MILRVEPDVLGLMNRIDVGYDDEVSDWARHNPDALTGIIAASTAACLIETGRDDGTIRYGLGVLFGSNEAIAALNSEWRGKPAPTNVLSWPGDVDGGAAQASPDGSVHLGDLAFALGVVEHEARERGVSVPDHLAVLAVHGVMHCLGFDHPTTEDAREMEAAEARALCRIGRPDPYAGTEPE